MYLVELFNQFVNLLVILLSKLLRLEFICCSCCLIALMRLFISVGMVLI